MTVSPDAAASQGQPPSCLRLEWTDPSSNARHVRRRQVIDPSKRTPPASAEKKFSGKRQKMKRADNCSSGYRRLSYPTALLWVTAALALPCAFGGLPAVAQSRDGARTNQAVLHIQATIVPAVVDPDNRCDNQHDLAIKYNLQRSDLRFWVTEESRYASIERRGSSGEEVILLRTTTVVLR